MHLHCNLCTGGFGCGPGNCGTMGANLTIWPASFQRHSPQCDHQSPLRSLTLRANSSSTLPLSSSNRTKSFPNQKPAHTHWPANLGGVTKISYFDTLLLVLLHWNALKANLSHNLEKAGHCIVFLEVATVKANQQVIRIPGEKIRLFKRWLQRFRAKPNKLWRPNVQ